MENHVLNAANFSYNHPLGQIYGWFTARGLSILRLPQSGSHPHIPVLHSSMNDLRVWALHEAMERYFRGQMETFQNIPLDLSRGTSFQQKVWNAAREIPWGKTCSYGELARHINMPGAARAVGQALNRNPVPIIIPCHRIIAQNGIGGFGAGLQWKKTLLNLEGLFFQ